MWLAGLKRGGGAARRCWWEGVDCGRRIGARAPGIFDLAPGNVWFEVDAGPSARWEITVESL